MPGRSDAGSGLPELFTFKRGSSYIPESVERSDPSSKGKAVAKLCPWCARSISLLGSDNEEGEPTILTQLDWLRR